MDYASQDTFWIIRLRRDFNKRLFAPGRILKPGEFNTFPGFPIAPNETGDCSLFWQHLETERLRRREGRSISMFEDGLPTYSRNPARSPVSPSWQ